MRSFRLRGDGWKKPLLVFSVVILGLYGYGYWLTYQDEYQSVPAGAWRTLDFEGIRGATRQPAGAGAVELSGDEAGAPGLRRAAGRFVRVVNENNPDAVLYHETDAFGNLYVVLGAWWGALPVEQRSRSLHALATSWRQYLFDSVGEWDTSEGFDPGIVVFDVEGEVARDMNGETVIHRQPIYE